jgi:hypothetical protein
MAVVIVPCRDAVVVGPASVDRGWSDQGRTFASRSAVARTRPLSDSESAPSRLLGRGDLITHRWPA